MSVEHFEALIDYVRKTDHLYAENYPKNTVTHPIPYFGNPESARVITVGVNPAASEFSDDRNWPRTMSAQELKDRLDSYFVSDYAPPHKWFRVWEEALNLVGVSYKNGTAAHLDLSPRSTINMGDVPNEELFVRMLAEDLEWFSKTLAMAKSARCVFPTGSVTKRWYINEFISKHGARHGIRLTPAFNRAANPGKGKTCTHQLVAPDIDLPVFFCSVSPSARNSRLLIDRIAENKDEIVSWLGDKGELHASTKKLQSMSEENYSEHYSEEGFWKKVKRFAAKLGRKGLETGFTLFYCLQDKDTPAWAKGVIVGALGYFILPLDAIPDLIPGVGFADDLGALAAALGTVAAYIKDEHKERAKEQVERLLGPEDEGEEGDGENDPTLLT